MVDFAGTILPALTPPTSRTLIVLLILTLVTHLKESWIPLVTQFEAMGPCLVVVHPHSANSLVCREEASLHGDQVVLLILIIHHKGLVEIAEVFPPNSHPTATWVDILQIILANIRTDLTRLLSHNPKSRFLTMQILVQGPRKGLLRHEITSSLLSRLSEMRMTD